MKTQSIFFSLLMLGCLAFPLMTSASELKERKETYSFERVIKPETQIVFENKVGALKVETWEKNSVKVDVSVSIDGDEEQVQKALDEIKKMAFVQDGEKVKFNTRFYTMMNGMIPGKFRITFLDGSTAKLAKLDLSFVLTMPKSNALNLTQAYEDATLPDLDGKIILDLYETDFTAGRLPNCETITAKYGKTEIDSVQDISLNLYENNLTLRHAGNIKLDSKYTESEIGTAGALTIDSYEDKIEVKHHGDLNVRAKYTTLNLADFNKSTFDLFECKLKAGNGSIIAIAAKYSSVDFISCKAIVFTTSFENTFNCELAGDFKAGSKYSSYRISRLDGNLNFINSFEDKITVMQVGKKFTGINILSKYSEVELLFEYGTPYKLDAEMKYTSFDYPKSAFREIKYHKEDEDFEYLGVTQGGDENTASVVKLQMYEGEAKLK